MYKLVNGDIEETGNLVQRTDGDLTLSVLYLAVIGTMHADQVGDLLLFYATLLP